jgi:hypothetical protein
VFEPVHAKMQSCAQFMLCFSSTKWLCRISLDWYLQESLKDAKSSPTPSLFSLSHQTWPASILCAVLKHLLAL